MYLDEIVSMKKSPVALLAITLVAVGALISIAAHHISKASGTITDHKVMQYGWQYDMNARLGTAGVASHGVDVKGLDRHRQRLQVLELFELDQTLLRLNKLYFDGADKLTWSQTNYSITRGQPFAGSSGRASMRRAAAIIEVFAGRRSSEQNALDFSSGLATENMLATANWHLEPLLAPKKLNFFVTGNLKITIDDNEYTCHGMRVGQGHRYDTLQNNWWIGAPQCRQRVLAKHMDCCGLTFSATLYANHFRISVLDQQAVVPVSRRDQVMNVIVDMFPSMFRKRNQPGSMNVFVEEPAQTLVGEMVDICIRAQVEDADGQVVDVSMGNFLTAVNTLRKVLATFGSSLDLVLGDVHKNYDGVKVSVENDPTMRATLRSFLQAELDTGHHNQGVGAECRLANPSAACQLEWLLRSIDFFLTVLQSQFAGQRDPEHRAYQQTLQPYHKWLTAMTVKAGLRFVPSKEKVSGNVDLCLRDVDPETCSAAIHRDVTRAADRMLPIIRRMIGIFQEFRLWETSTV